MVSDYVSSIKLEYRKLQTKIEKLEKENHLLAAELGYREPNFCGNILAFVESLFLNTKYSDVLFKTPDVLVPGHKFVLDARGGVWDIYTENGVEYIDMRGYCQSVCEALILWAYKGVLEKYEAECLSKLMVLAKEYCLPSLFSQCEIALIPLVTRENCLSLYSSSYDVKASKLLDHCFLFLSGVWQNLPSEEISTINAPVLQSFLERYSKFPVHSAIELGRDDTVMSLLEGNPVKARLLVNQLNENGLSPLFMALQAMHFKLAEKLIDLGADINALIGPVDQKQPVAQFAFSNKLFDAVQFLLLHGSCCNFSDPISSRTLLHKLAVTDCKELSDSVIDIAKTLLKQDVNISCQDTNGNSPLHLSILHNNSDIFKLLLSCAKKPDLDLPNNQGLCPLWLALVSQLIPWDSFSPGVYGFHSDDLATHSCDFASLLIENGANVNYRFTDVCLSSLKSSMSSKVPLPGDTLLMAAARIGWESAALFLLDHPQCDPTLESTFTQGETVFHVAVEAELFELCNRLVVRKEIDPNRLRYSQVVVLNEDCEISKKVTCLEKVSGSKIVKSLNPFDDDYDSNIDPDVASNSVDNICHSNSSHGISNPTITSQQFSPTTPSSSVIIDNTEFTQQLYCSPLHLAVKHKMFELVKFYLQEKGDVDWSLLNESGESVFSLLLWSEEFQLIIQVLEYMYSQSKNISDCNHNLSFRKSDEGINWFRNLISSKCNKSLLIEAIERGQLEVVKFLISQGADIDEKFFIENNFRTFVHPLWIALKLRKWEIANYLVDCGIDVNAWALFDPNVKITLLHRAICENNEEAAIFLVKRNCDVNVCPQLDNCKLSYETTNHSDYLMPYLARSPLHIAISVGMYELVKALVNCNRVHVNQQDYNGETPLHLAVKSRDEKLVKLLIETPQIDCSIRDAQGHTVFHMAIDSRQRTIAEILIKKDPSLALQVDIAGRNFLHTAIENMDREAIFLLIQIGVDMNACVRDVHRLTPFHLAIKTGVDEDILRSLLLAGASISSQTPQKQYGLHLAVIYDRPQLVHCLLENGADANAQDSEWNTPVHLAVRHAKMDCLVKLLNHPATNCCNVNIRGQLPIHLLAQHQDPVGVEMLQSLLELSVTNQINAQDAAGNTPLLLAYQAENIPLCIALLHAGASLGTMNAEGDTVFTLNKKKCKVSSPGRVLSQLLDSLIQEPRWEDGSICVECCVKFGITNRKHHCRHCGRLLCSQCSAFEIPIVKYELSKPVRVCEVCFNFLNNPF